MPPSSLQHLLYNELSLLIIASQLRRLQAVSGYYAKTWSCRSQVGAASAVDWFFTFMLPVVPIVSLLIPADRQLKGHNLIKG